MSAIVLSAILTLTQAKFGIPSVTAKVIQMYPDYLSQLQELRKWIENQRTFYQNGLHGKKNSLSDERIRLLMQANFDFSSNRCQSLHYKSWNEKLQELKEFKQMYVQTMRMSYSLRCGCLTLFLLPQTWSYQSKAN